MQVDAELRAAVYELDLSEEGMLTDRRLGGDLAREDPRAVGETPTRG